MRNHQNQIEDGIVIGNQVDKSELSNPISRRLVQGFDRALLKGLDSLQPKSIHEVGCGEGRLTRMMRERYRTEVLATDFSKTIIEANRKIDPDSGIQYTNRSIYDLKTESDARDIVVCCEVLEHLEDPNRGLLALKSLGARGYILSVPREPLWRALNMFRGKYWKHWGNTPGHLNHWSFGTFSAQLERCGFSLKDVYNPLPWIMVSATLRGE